MNTHKTKMPIIKSCNLKLNETIGQGKHNYINIMQQLAGTRLYVGEFGIVYKAYLSKECSRLGRDLVAVKTLKGMHMSQYIVAMHLHRALLY